jgi:sugar phosphate isomerase/epimerase
MLGRPMDYVEAARPLARALIKNPAPDFVELGQGSLDACTFWKAVTRSGFRGWATIELDVPSLVARKSAHRSLRYLRKVCLLQ